MNVHKICAHAVLSLVFVSSVTSHGMGIQKPVLVGGIILAGAAVLVVGTKVAYEYGKSEMKKYKKELGKDLQQKYGVPRSQMVQDWKALYAASGAKGHELVRMTNSATDPHGKNPITNFIDALIPAAKAYNDKMEADATEARVPRGVQTCSDFSKLSKN